MTSDGRRDPRLLEVVRELRAREPPARRRRSARVVARPGPRGLRSACFAAVGLASLVAQPLAAWLLERRWIGGGNYIALSLGAAGLFFVCLVGGARGASP